MRWVRFAVPCGTLLIVALGQSPVRAEQLWFMPELPLAKVEEVMRLARDNLHLAVLADGSHVPRETPEEQARPLISKDLARRVVDVGIVSAMAKWCGVEWFEFELPPFHDRGARQWPPAQGHGLSRSDARYHHEPHGQRRRHGVQRRPAGQHCELHRRALARMTSCESAGRQARLRAAETLIGCVRALS